MIHGWLSTDRDGIGDEIAAGRLIADGTTADEFALTDAPYLALMAGRMVPQPLMDPSNSRTRLAHSPKSS